MDNETEYLSPKQAAKILGVHYLTVLSYVNKGILPSKRLGRMFKIPKTAVMNEVAKNGEA